MLGSLSEKDDRVIPIAFHVDYFNKPWKDPYSDGRFSRREMQYSLLYDKQFRLNKPDYLYLTPLLMVDGRQPMVGSNADAPQKARDSIARFLKEPAEVGLAAAFSEEKATRKRMVEVALSTRSSRIAGKGVLVGVITYEDGPRTKVESGELAGKTYVNRYVARSLEVKSVNPRSGVSTRLSVPVALPEDADPARCGVVVYAQEESTGRILQAERVRWPVKEEPKAEAKAGPER